MEKGKNVISESIYSFGNVEFKYTKGIAKLYYATPFVLFNSRVFKI